METRLTKSRMGVSLNLDSVFSIQEFPILQSPSFSVTISHMFVVKHIELEQDE